MGRHGRSCCVMGCDDPDPDDNAKPKIKRSFFKLPQDPNALKKWHDVLDPYIRQGKKNQKMVYLCSLHFSPSCFFHNKQKILINGVEVLLPRQQQRLRPGSVPSIFNVVQQQINKKLDSSANTDTTKDTSMRAKCEAENKKNVLSVQPNVAATIASDEFEVLMDMVCLEPLPDNYSNADLVDDWENKYSQNVPQNWKMMRTPAGVSFTHVGDMNQSVTDARSILVRSDMSVEIQVRGKTASFPKFDEIKSFHDVLTAMFKITCLRVCTASNCSAGFFVPVPRSSSVKCKPCQKESRRKKNREAQQRKRLQRRNNQDIKFWKKLPQSKDKISHLEKEINEFIVKCSKANEKTTKQCSKTLPPQMTEADVQTCYSQIGDKTGLHSTKKWMLECLLLRIKSRKAYLHLRENKIFVLPNLKTLNRYMQNLKAYKVLTQNSQDKSCGNEA